MKAAASRLKKQLRTDVLVFGIAKFAFQRIHSAPTTSRYSIMSKTDEGAALGHASFWDERYSKAGDSTEPTHEWFRDFASLEPFFEKHLFTARKPDAKPQILHLGSGDSVGGITKASRWLMTDKCTDCTLRSVEERIRQPIVS